MDRLRKHGVRREEEDERHLIRNHPAAARLPNTSGTEQQSRVGVQQRPTQVAREPAGLLVVVRPPPGPGEAARRAATTSTPTYAITPPVPAKARRSFSPSERSKPGEAPVAMRNATRQVIITTVLPMGAIAVIANWRRAYNSPVAIAPHAYNTT
jgi:hypothetical protein